MIAIHKPWTKKSFETFLVVEGAGPSWSEYLLDMRELEVRILANRKRQARADVPSGLIRQQDQNDYF